MSEMVDVNSNTNDVVRISKRETRLLALARRDALDPTERDRLSKVISRFLLDAAWFQLADTIHCYKNFRSEVETADIIEVAMTLERRVFVPHVGTDKLLYHSELFRSAILSNDALGIPVPNGSDLRASLELPRLDIVVIPVVAFDSSFNRLGYGAGYYDRFLGEAKVRAVLKVGLAFECQRVESIQTEGHDVPLDIVVTERGVFERSLKSSPR